MLEITIGHLALRMYSVPVKHSSRYEGRLRNDDRQRDK